MPKYCHCHHQVSDPCPMKRFQHFQACFFQDRSFSDSGLPTYVFTRYIRSWERGRNSRVRYVWMSLGQKMITYVTQVSNRAMNISPGRSIPKHLSKACTTFRRFCHRVFVPKFESTEGEIDAVIRKLNNFVATNRGLFVLTGAGTSTESGIRDYRSEGVGLYAVSNNRPIQFKDFLKDADKRRSYWARNYVGWPEFSSREPNAGHLALARLEKLGVVHWLVTQNVDALHSKAGSRRVTELHGCSHRYAKLVPNYTHPHPPKWIYAT